MNESDTDARMSDEELTLEVTEVEGHTVIAAHGEIDISSAPVLRAAVEGAIDAGVQVIIVDLDGVSFMDSSGLNTIIGVVKRLEPGALRVVCSQAHIRRIFSITGTDKVIRIFDSRQAAIAGKS
jgi:anti-sigma B factor antagonist